MDSKTLAALCGMIVSLACTYIPGLRQKFARLDPDWKRLIMVCALAVTAIGVYVAGCYFGVQTGVTCDRAGVLGLVNAFLSAFAVNQATFLASPFKSNGR
jgi:hypothetical protein